MGPDMFAGHRNAGLSGCSIKGTVLASITRAWGGLTTWKCLGATGHVTRGLGDAYDLPCYVPESPERAAQWVSWERDKNVRYLGNRYRNHESSRVGSRLVYKEWILDS